MSSGSSSPSGTVGDTVIGALSSSYVNAGNGAAGLRRAGRRGVPLARDAISLTTPPSAVAVLVIAALLA